MGGHVRFTIPVKPKPKQRPQHGRGYTYTPKETREYEQMAGIYARMAVKRPLEGAIRVKVDFYIPIPKSWPEGKKRLAEAGEIRPASRPDLDNLEKALFDGINGIVWIDDAQVVEVHKAEWYGDPRTDVEISEV